MRWLSFCEEHYKVFFWTLLICSLLVGGFLAFITWKPEPLESLSNNIGIIAIVFCWSFCVLLLEHRASMEAIRSEYRELLDHTDPQQQAHGQEKVSQRGEVIAIHSVAKLLAIVGTTAAALVIYYFQSKPKDTTPPPEISISGSGTIKAALIERLPGISDACKNFHSRFFNTGSMQAIESISWLTYPQAASSAALMSTRFTPNLQEHDPLIARKFFIEVFLGFDEVVAIANTSNEGVEDITQANLSRLLLSKESMTWTDLSGNMSKLGGKNVELMIPRGCGNTNQTSGTCHELSQHLLAGGPIQAKISTQQSSALVERIHLDVELNPSALGLVSRLFLTHSEGRWKELTVDGRQFVVRRALWAYVPFDPSSSGYRISDKRILECILDPDTQRKLHGLYKTELPGDIPARDQLQWLLGNGEIDTSHYVESQVTQNSGTLLRLKDEDSGRSWSIHPTQESKSARPSPR